MCIRDRLGKPHLFECDVSDMATVDALFHDLKALWGEIDFVVHAIGFSDKNELRGRYVDTSHANFMMTMDISVYSFTAVCKRAAAMMRHGGSLLTMTYYGAEQVMPHYNVMGIAKAALEASACAIPQAMDLSFARPMIRPRLPCINPADIAVSVPEEYWASNRRKVAVHQGRVGGHGA